jgi:hypothetical protein
MMNTYPKGALIRESVALVKLDGVTPITQAPTSLSVHWSVNATGVPGATTVKTWPTDGVVVQDSVDKYHIDFDSTALPGIWTGSWDTPSGSPSQAATPDFTFNIGDSKVR